MLVLRNIATKALCAVDKETKKSRKGSSGTWTMAFFDSVLVSFSVILQSFAPCLKVF